MHAVIGMLVVLLFWLFVGVPQTEPRYSWTIVIMSFALGAAVSQLREWRRKISKFERVGSRASQFVKEFVPFRELGANVNWLLHFHANSRHSARNIEELHQLAKDGERILGLNLCLKDTAQDYMEEPPSPNPDRRPSASRVA